MTFQSILDQAGEDLFDHAGLDSTFTPSVGDPVSCKVRIESSVEDQPVGESSVWEVVTTLEYRYDEVGKEADPGETFLVGAVTYTVKAVLENEDSRFIKVAVK